MKNELQVCTGTVPVHTGGSLSSLLPLSPLISLEKAVGFRAAQALQAANTM